MPHPGSPEPTGLAAGTRGASGLLALLLLLATAPPSSAQILNASELRIDTLFEANDGGALESDPDQFLLDVGPSSTPNFLDVTVNDTSNLHDSLIEAYVEPGLIQLQTSTLPADGEFGSLASVGARFTDQLLFAPPIPGFGTAIATAVITYDGSFSFPGAPVAAGQFLSSALDLRAVSGVGSILNSVREEASCMAPCPATITLPGATALIFEFAFVWGAPFELSIQVDLNSSVSGFVGDTGNPGALALFDQTIAWGGITSVRETDGTLVDGWDVTSGSGFDYANPHPIPEPGTSLLLASGLIWLAARRRS